MKVTRVIDQYNFVIQKSDRSKPIVVHRDKLKPYFAPDPNWQDPAPVTPVSGPADNDLSQGLDTGNFSDESDVISPQLHIADRPRRAYRQPARFQGFVMNPVYVVNSLSVHNSDCFCCTYMPMVDTSSSLDVNDGYPHLHDLLHTDNSAFVDVHDGDDDTLSARQHFTHAVNLAPALTGPASFAPAPIEEPAHCSIISSVAITPTTTQHCSPRRKHRAGRQVKARRLRAQLRDLNAAKQLADPTVIHSPVHRVTSPIHHDDTRDYCYDQLTSSCEAASSRQLLF
jgi:hypothetical protein